MLRNRRRETSPLTQVVAWCCSGVGAFRAQPSWALFHRHHVFIGWPVLHSDSCLFESIQSHTYIFKPNLVARTRTTQGQDEQNHLRERFGSCHVLFLGTASACPGKLRNVSGIYVGGLDVPTSEAGVSDGEGGLLLDCGDGTLGQMFRHFGPHRVARAVRNLRCVWISHMHADHHTGLQQLLEYHARVGGGQQIVVIGPSKLQHSIELFSKITTPHFDVIFSRLDEGVVADAGVRRVLADSLGITELRNVPVDHIHDSFGVVIRHTRGWKLVYSGDTRPTHELVRQGRNADLLIHEATFDDSFAREAKEKKHSTFSEALNVSRRMNASHTVLTHFSARYQRVVPLPSDNTRGSCLVASDLMNLSLSKLADVSTSGLASLAAWVARHVETHKDRLGKGLVGSLGETKSCDKGGSKAEGSARGRGA